MTLARAVGSRGRVTGIDLSHRMVEIARAEAKAQSVENVEFHAKDAEAVTLPDASLDLVVSRFGIQIVTNPEKAVAEMHRVLKPGGRIALTVWGLAERCPAIHAIIGPMLENAEPDETGYLPTPYEMGGPGELVEILHAAGFVDGHEARVMLPISYGNEAEFMTATLQGTPIGHSLREEPEEVQREVVRKTRDNLRPWAQADGRLVMPSECVVVSALRK